jgi:hypothetical protein
MKTDILEYTVGNYALPYLINGDTSGLCDTELLRLEVFANSAIQQAKKLGAKSYHWTVETECQKYGRDEISGLFSDCSDVALVIMF